MFIDEAAFHISLKCCFSWSKVGTHAIVKTSETKPKMMTMLGAISPYEVVNLKARIPKVATATSKKKESLKMIKKKSTVTGHYFNFVA